MATSEQFSRLFTVEEANNLLPLLRPLMKQIFDKLDFLRLETETVIREENLSPDSPNSEPDGATARKGHDCLLDSGG